MPGILTVLFLAALPCRGFDILPSIIDNIDMIEYPGGGRNVSQKQAIMRLQAYLLHDLFLDPILNDESIKAFNEDDDEENLVPTDFKSQNQMLAQILARELARKDMLGLEKILMQNPAMQAQMYREGQRLDR